MSEKTQVQIVNDEIAIELGDQKTRQTLLATTFKGFTPILMHQAILEGMLRGFTFRNFLQKDVFAQLFNSRDGQTYSLITSIGHARKIGQKSGCCGKSEPTYEMETESPSGKQHILTCSVTVKKLIGSYVGDYTAKVYFDEYNTGKNTWLSKPRTMIAKVAEMHALRSAFPEELDKVYVEEEFEKGSRISEVKDMVENNNLKMGDHIKKDEKVTNKKEESTEDDVVIIPDSDNPFDKGGKKV